MRSWIKCVIFDLDGVIVDTRNLHFKSFRDSVQTLVPGFTVSEDWYHSYDGISSRQKLDILTRESGLPRESHDDIMSMKEELTLKLIDREVRPDYEKLKLFHAVKSCHDVKIVIASNSRRSFIEAIVKRLEIGNKVDVLIGGDEVKFPKPNSQIYLKVMADLAVSPHETVIFEDAPAGQKAALDSGAHLVQVKNTGDVTYPWVIREIRNAERNNRYNQFDATILYGLKKINVVVPMAGLGSRFQKAGYTIPKPFIPIRGKSMVQVTIDSVGIPGNYVYCVQREHLEKFDVSMRELVNHGDHTVPIDGLTEGAACTVLKAKQYIDTDDPLFIVNSDQYIEWDFTRFMIEALKQNVDGGIVTFEASGPKWSYAKTESDHSNVVTEVAEKNPISTHATVGIYYWRRGSDFVKSAEKMIESDTRVNGEFYIAPTYNEAIRDGKKIIIFSCERMLGLGTPEDLDAHVSLL